MRTDPLARPAFGSMFFAAQSIALDATRGPPAPRPRGARRSRISAAPFTNATSATKPHASSLESTDTDAAWTDVAAVEAAFHAARHTPRHLRALGRDTIRLRNCSCHRLTTGLVIN